MKDCPLECNIDLSTLDAFLFFYSSIYLSLKLMDFFLFLNGIDSHFELKRFPFSVFVCEEFDKILAPLCDKVGFLKLWFLR